MPMAPALKEGNRIRIATLDSPGFDVFGEGDLDFESDRRVQRLVYAVAEGAFEVRRGGAARLTEAVRFRVTDVFDAAERSETLIMAEGVSIMDERDRWVPFSKGKTIFRAHLGATPYDDERRIQELWEKIGILKNERSRRTGDGNPS